MDQTRIEMRSNPISDAHTCRCVQFTSPTSMTLPNQRPPSEHTDSREAFVAVLLRGGQGGEEREDGEFRWG